MISCADDAGSGNLVRRMPQTLGDVLARCRIVDRPLAGQLIALLPVLAAALSVALAGDHRAARAFAPMLPVARR